MRSSSPTLTRRPLDLGRRSATPPGSNAASCTPTRRPLWATRAAPTPPPDPAPRSLVDPRRADRPGNLSSCVPRTTMRFTRSVTPFAPSVREVHFTRPDGTPVPETPQLEPRPTGRTRHRRAHGRYLAMEDARAHLGRRTTRPRSPHRRHGGQLHHCHRPPPRGCHDLSPSAKPPAGRSRRLTVQETGVQETECSP